VLGQPLAQLCVHGAVLRLIESFFEYLGIEVKYSAKVKRGGEVMG